MKNVGRVWADVTHILFIQILYLLVVEQDGSVVPREGAVRSAAGNAAEGIAGAFPGGSLVRGKGQCSRKLA